MIWLKLLVESRGGPGVFTAAATRTPERYEAIIRILLDAGADPNELPMPPARLGPLGVLADTPPFDGDVRLAQLLLDHGASLENSLAVASALAVAAENGRVDLVTPMVSGGRATAQALNDALRGAARGDHLDAAETLLTAGADPNIAGNLREPLLCEAMEKTNVGRMRPLVPMLLAHHANANVSCRSGGPPIVGVRDRETAVQLLDHGADPNRAAFEIKLYGEGHESFRTGAQTALMYAATAGQAEASRLLLMHGADRDKKDAEGYSASQYVNTAAVRDVFVSSPKSH